MNVYECKSSSCALGSRQTSGRFSGGASKELITTITGDPDPENHGDGVCPVCGEKGTPVSGVPALGKGKDPYQHLHDKVGQEVSQKFAKLSSRVADPDDDMDDATAKEEHAANAAEAQDRLMRLIEREEGEKS